MGFGEKWRLWIRGCIKSARASVLVNGVPTKEFSMERWVRQGDPLSPFLFVIAMEGLNVALKITCIKGIFKGVQLPNNGPVISHLLYADDALFLGEWCFHVSSGLKVNFNKSKVFGIGSSTSEASHWASSLGREPSCLPFTYLGVPFPSKLTSWKSKNLLFVGRLTLITFVLGNLPTYYLSSLLLLREYLNNWKKLGGPSFGVVQMTLQKSVGSLGIRLQQQSTMGV
uniref:Reverse transcriptase domain-containing protein n=1 Tax=Lactuca sativa TaxID=4236 RepID=A0A9R1VUS4_LACSA|nr:hypothetical protein LSAT_V11C400182700 [Lactuca sativa]